MTRGNSVSPACSFDKDKFLEGRTKEVSLIADDTILEKYTMDYRVNCYHTVFNLLIIVHPSQNQNIQWFLFSKVVSQGEKSVGNSHYLTLCAIT